MREIKFRAWIDKKMKPITFLFFTKDGCLLKVPLMQYTGLKDKNGVESYGSDLIKFCLYQSPIGNLKEEYIGEIIFLKGCFFVKFINRWKGFTGEEELLPLYRIQESEDGFEVIGNIYENPELLKEALQ